MLLEGLATFSDHCMQHLALDSLNILKCTLTALCEVHELIRFGYRKSFKWTVERDTYMHRP